MRSVGMRIDRSRLSSSSVLLGELLLPRCNFDYFFTEKLRAQHTPGTNGGQAQAGPVRGPSLGPWIVDGTLLLGRANQGELTEQTREQIKDQRKES